MGSSKCLVNVSSLNKSFGDVKALRDFSICVNEGEIAGIVGPDGAGKTTAMRIMSTVSVPDSGSILIEGCDALKDYRTARKSIGYMSQKFGLYQDMTVEENIRFFADVQDVPRKQITERMDSLLKSADMDKFKSRLSGNLSGGMKQKLALCCALIHRPRTLILDEPTNGVDPVSRREFWQLLNGFTTEGTAIVYATSYLDEAERCNVVNLMSKGRIIASGNPAKLKKIDNVTVFEIKGGIVRELIKKLPDNIGRIWSFGSSVHVHSREGLATVDTLKAMLGSGYSVGIISPSLEDVFTFLTGEVIPHE